MKNRTIFFMPKSYPCPRASMSFPRASMSVPRASMSVPRFVHGLSTVHWRFKSFHIYFELEMFRALKLYCQHS